MTEKAIYTPALLQPLTHPQKRIWYIEQLYPDTSLYNIGGPVRVRGPVNFEWLEAAIQSFIRRHEGLRTRIAERDGQAGQYVAPYETEPLAIVDFSIYADPEQEFVRWTEREAQKPFSLTGGKLYDFVLFRIGDNDGGYLVRFHHIIADGWSINIMTGQIHDAYELIAKGEMPREEAEPSYLDYIGLERNYLQSDRFVKNKLFWNETFKTLPETELRESSDRIEGLRRKVVLEAELSSDIKTFAAETKSSLNTFFVFLYLLYAARTTGQDETVVGTPVLNRSGQKEKRMFGMFTSTMPFRFTLNGSVTVAQALSDIQRELMSCYFHQRYPYDLLIQDLELKRSGRDQLFNVCVNYYNTKLPTELNGSPVENIEFYSGYQMYSMQWVIKDWSDAEGLQLAIDYKVDDYSESDIDLMLNRLRHLIAQVLKSPNALVGELSLVTPEEREWLLHGFNATEATYPKDETIHALIEAQALRTPDRIAVRDGGQAWTYRELNGRANRLAGRLREEGVGAGEKVGIWTAHSLETVVAILAVLKAGGAYVPIDPSYLEARVAYMLEDSGARLVLTNQELPVPAGYTGKLIQLNDASLYAGGDEENGPAQSGPNELAYMIYTSGSTGKPKGVMIEHRGLVNYIWWANRVYVKNDNEVFALYSSIAFDLTVTSVFTPLIGGGTIEVYRDDQEEYVLHRIVRDKLATVVKLTPSHLSLLKDQDHSQSAIRTFIVGGEDFKVSLAKSIHSGWGGNVEQYNEYGPTETVVGCMIHRYDPERDVQASVPIGVPASNVRIYILDRHGKPVPLFALGELYIGGDGVGRGYANRDELTAERFLADPFVPGGRMYRTGDLGRMAESGRIEYAGRVDQQVKIRGYRIEPGEIEKRLLAHAAVKDAVVIDREHADHSKYLCAYVVLGRPIAEGELRLYLLGELPEYMVPSFFVEVDEIPLTVSGKVNRAMLPAPELARGDETADEAGSGDEREQLLLDVLSDVLQTEAVRRSDNFYRLGGDSIKAIQVSSKLKSAGYRLRVKDIWSNPVVSDMLLWLQPNEETSVADQTPSVGAVPPLPIVSWFFERDFPSPHHYHQSLLLQLKRQVDADVLESALSALIRHHDALRLFADPQTGVLTYKPFTEQDTAFVERCELSRLEPCEAALRLSGYGERFKAEFDLGGPLFKACLFEGGEDGAKLLLVAHHLVVDGVSWRILLDDLAQMLENYYSSAVKPLPPKTGSLQQWGVALGKLAETAIGELGYWQAALDAVSTLPRDFDRGMATIGSARTIQRQWAERDTERLLKETGGAYGTEPQELMLAALALAVSDRFGLGETVIELEGHGREDIGEPVDVSRTVGWFTSLYPVRLTSDRASLPASIKTVKEQLRRVPRRGIGYGVLRYLSGVLMEKVPSRIRFNFLGDFDATFRNPWFEWAPESTGPDSSPDNPLTTWIDINAWIVGGQLHVTIAYSVNLFKETTMDELAEAFALRLREITDHCCGKQDTDFTPSDFDTVQLSQDELDGLLL